MSEGTHQDGRYCRVASVEAIVGVTGTGKTQRLVEKVASVLGGGVAPADVLVLAASPTAAQAIERRLAAACGTGVRVTTPMTLASEGLRALGAPRSHVASSFEQNFFLEDMRVTGEKQRRLKEMLKFFQRGWSEMREEEEGWLITGEEEVKNAFAHSRLAFMQVLLSAEATAEYVRALLASPETLASAKVKWVFADDFNAMSRASQRLASLIASEGLVFAWNPVGGLLGEEPYGYADGLAEAEEAALAAGASWERVDLAESRLAAKPAGVVANLFGQACMADVAVTAPAVASGAPEGSFESVVAPALEDEMAGVCSLVQGFLDAGGVPGEVCVAVPTDAWGRRVRNALEAAGIPASMVAQRQTLGGDIRDLSKSSAAAVYNALHLVADPDSACAWRCWCGFGDYLTCSAGVSKLLEAAAGEAALPQMLALLAERPDDSALSSIDVARLAERYAKGRELVEAAAGLAGAELLAAVSRAALGTDEVPHDLAALLGDVSPDEDARVLYARAEAALTAPRFAEGAVRICGWDALLGQDVRSVVLCGMVNGLVPREDYFDLSMATIEAQEKMHARLTERLINVSGKARENLACTGFATVGIVESETLKLKCERIRLRGGKRVCELGPNVCVRYMKGELLDRER